MNSIFQNGTTSLSFKGISKSRFPLISKPTLLGMLLNLIGSSIGVGLPPVSTSLTFRTCIAELTQSVGCWRYLRITQKSSLRFTNLPPPSTSEASGGIGWPAKSCPIGCLIRKAFVLACVFSHTLTFFVLQNMRISLVAW